MQNRQDAFGKLEKEGFDAYPHKYNVEMRYVISV
jgi:hypothetical protein